MKAQLQQRADRASPALRRPRLRALGVALFGDPDSVDLSHRILNTIMFLAVLTGAAATVQNLIIAASPVMIWATAASAVAGALGYWAARKRLARRALPALLYLFYLLLLVFAWMTQAGSHGTAGYFFILLICFAVVLFHGPSQILSVGATAVTVIGLVLIEQRAPWLIVDYASPRDRFADVAMALPLCLLMVAMVLDLVYREYHRERVSKDAVLALVTAEKERVERAMREKQRLLTVVSHDIANALVVLQGEISLSRFSDRADKPAHPLDVERMAYACTNIDEIISSVRMMEALEQGRVTFRAKPVDLSAVFEYAEVIFGKRLAQRRMRFSFPELTDENRFVLAEPRILANQVFGNLLSNAIKFSHPESDIAVTVARHGAETSIAVLDHGIGIPDDLAARLFDLEANVTRPGTDGEPGTGFGLRTVKHFVELFGGRLAIDSRVAPHPEPGTTVTVHLKHADAQPE